MLTRRTFLQTPVIAAAAPRPAQPKRLAIVTTIYRFLSHGQHMGDRFLAGYPYAAVPHPFGSLSPAEVSARADKVVDRIEQLLLEN